MRKTEFPAAIKSRPVYGVLEPRPGALHLVVADGEGAEAVADLLGRASDRAAMLADLHIIYAPGPTGTDQTALLQALAAARFFRAPTIPMLLPHLQEVLTDARMGT